MKPRNLRIYSLDKEYLARLRSDYILLGFDTSLEPGCLTVHALPRRRKKRKEKLKKTRKRN